MAHNLDLADGLGPVSGAGVPFGLVPGGPLRRFLASRCGSVFGVGFEVLFEAVVGCCGWGRFPLVLFLELDLLWSRVPLTSGTLGSFAAAKGASFLAVEAGAELDSLYFSAACSATISNCS